jgi:hypothetical protein
MGALSAKVSPKMVHSLFVEGTLIGSFTLTTFVSETVGDSDTLLALATLGDMMAKVSIYSAISWA